MTRHVRSEQADIETAMRLASMAETAAQLRQSQAILIPALTGASLDVAAAILGISRGRLDALRRKFRSGESAGDTGTHGGRRRALMSVDAERQFIAPWLESLRSGEALPVTEIASAYQQAIGRAVPRSTIYRLLARHGWRRAADRRRAS